MKNSCIYCGHKIFYKVSETQRRCCACHKKWSYKKVEQHLLILNAFIENKSALEASELLRLNYATITKMYSFFRQLILQEAHQTSHSFYPFTEYDEFYYLPHSKKRDPDFLFDAIGILGMLYDDKVYTLLLPNHFEHMRENFHDAAEKERYLKFLTQRKLTHINSFDNKLTLFWTFLEESMNRYKGVSKENFSVYLKEIEFKFNHTKKEQRLILETLLWSTYRQK